MKRRKGRKNKKMVKKTNFLPTNCCSFFCPNLLCFCFNFIPRLSIFQLDNSIVSLLTAIWLFIDNHFSIKFTTKANGKGKMIMEMSIEFHENREWFLSIMNNIFFHLFYSSLHIIHIAIIIMCINNLFNVLTIVIIIW